MAISNSSSTSSSLVLGSGSPRRAELIERLIPRERLIIDPARGFVEPRCENAADLDEVRTFVGELATSKAMAVRGQRQDTIPILSADTVVVANEGGRPVVLGKPPEGAEYEPTLRDWWTRLLSGRPHHVLTAVTLLDASSSSTTIVVETEVTFVEIDDRAAAWYLATGEPAGKAGGYAIQGEGAMFVERLVGSFSNVVGLPVWETRALLNSGGIATTL